MFLSPVINAPAALSMRHASFALREKCSYSRQRRNALFSKETLQTVADRWHVRLKKLRHDISIQGSPERSVFRVGLKMKMASFLCWSKCHRNIFNIKRKIAGTLDFLSEKNLLRIQPYLAADKRKHVIKYKNCVGK